MDDASLFTIADWRTAYDAGASPAALLHQRRERLAASSPRELWISLASAAEIDAQLAALAERAAPHGDRHSRTRALPLYGVPFAVKDNIDVAGFATTAACLAYRYQPAANAHVVERLLAAGAVCIGKTNLDQFATGLVGSRSPYGRPSSALDPTRISGGSSSGSAVAVARGDVPVALGTDTAGSGRVPAAFNNIVGLKPTPGRIGTRGVVPACRSIDCVSIFALTVAEAALVLALAEGADAQDPYSDFRLGPARLPKTLRVGIPAGADVDGNVDGGYGEAFERAVSHLRALGHTPVRLDFAPLHHVAGLLYEGPWVAERHAVVQELLERDPQALDPSVRAVIEAARGHSATDLFRGLHTLRAARHAAADLWRDVDLLMVPSAPAHPTHREVDAEPLRVNARLGLYTNFVNLLGWCALALPAEVSAEGLPFGVTFIAPAASDAALARFGSTWQGSLELRLGATPRSRPAAAAGEPAAESWPASEATQAIAVVGAHLGGLPLNHQLLERGATLRASTRTAPTYRLYALANTTPPKPGLVGVERGGAAIEVEVWEVPSAQVGSFLALVAAPLGLGSVELADGSRVHGFLCEAHAVAGAVDITDHGGWRPYLASLRADPDPPCDAVASTPSTVQASKATA